MSDKRPFKRPSGPMFLPRGATEKVQGLAFMHPCFVEDCRAWGSFGFIPKRGDPGTWACGQHKGLLTGFAHDAPANPETTNVESNDHPDRLV